MAIKINDQLTLDENELHFEFVLASGPGGQNVNKVAPAVKLYFDLNHSRSLPPEVISRLQRLAARRINRDGVLIIDARRFRSQQKNRYDAISRLVELILRALQVKKKRIPSRPKQSAIEKRIREKKLHAEQKRLRRKGHLLD